MSGRWSPCAGLDGCRECPMCGGCEVHEGCAADWNHIAWHARFASPGEDACGEIGIVAGRPYACALPATHGGEWHQGPGGDGWPITREAAA